MEFSSSQKNLGIASIILAGGKGTRLFPLTLNHSKPGVSYGGRYKLIDIPISNSLNSNIRQIIVIGQYLVAELQHHLTQTYQFDYFLILSGDQLYNIDFQKMFEFAKKRDADLTIASLSVNETDAKRMGLL